MKQQIFECIINSLTPEGKGYLFYKNKHLYVIGALPGETVRCRIVKKRKLYREAVVEEVLSPSPYRLPSADSVPVEDHYLSCSPWQPISYDHQIHLKHQMLLHAYAEAGINLDQTETPQASVVVHGAPEQEQTGYRTKLEFSFWNEEGQMYIAFHTRGSPFIKTALPHGCILGSDAMNNAALAIVERLNELKIEKNDLKVLIIRESKTTGMVTALLLTKRQDLVIPLSLESLQQVIPQLKGLMIASSPPLSPAAIIETVLHEEGDMELEEVIEGLRIRYPYDGFFQNHIPQFSRALQRIQEYTPPSDKIVELYSGAGTIGLNLHSKAKELVGVEIVPSAVRYARINAAQNKISNYTIIEAPSEQMPQDTLADTDVLIIDPPRSGMHGDVIEMILTHTPKRILYLSCNPVTQARDIALLLEQYSLSLLEGYDFYPHALHLESLAVLDRK